MGLKPGENRKTAAWAAAIAGIASILFFYLSMCLITIADEREIFLPLLAAGALTVIAYFFCIYRCTKDDLVNRKQLFLVNSCFAFVCIIILFSDFTNLSSDSRNGILLTEMIWSIILLTAEGYLYAGLRCRKTITGNSIKQYKWLIGLLFLLAILAIDYHGIQFKWDGLLYYQTCQDLDIHSLSSLAIYGHTAQTFGALVQIGVLLFRGVAFSMAFMNILLLLCSSAAFYGIIKTVAPGGTDFLYAAGTAVYGFSPFLLGMVNYYNLDYYCLCFFTIVFFFACRRQWYSFFIVSFLFCFTKEPAVIAYGGLCLGIVLTDFINDAEYPFGRRVIRVLQNPRYYTMILPALLWLATYLLLGPWSAGDGGMAVDPLYVADKLKVLYVLNFNWIFALILIGGILYLIYSKDMLWKKNGWLICLLCSLFCFTLFSCLFQTVNHPRYSDIAPVCLYLVGVVFVLRISRPFVRNVLTGILAAIMLISSYYTLDPISMLVFDTVDVGKATMVVAQKNAPGDGMIYNKQPLQFEHALNKALSEAVEQEEIIIFPAVEGSNYNFDGMAPLLTVSAGYRYCTEYWDEKRVKRSSVEQESTVPLQINYVKDVDGIEALIEDLAREGDTLSYFYLPCAGADLAEEIRNQYDMIEEKEYTLGGWRVSRLVFGKKS